VRALARIEAAAARHGLAVMGAFHPARTDAPDLPPGTRTLVLLGPDGGAFWPALGAAPEGQDGAPDPVDRFSRRVIGRMACDLGAKALFPFGGPPWRPFYAWAVRSGRAWPSPVRLLVHERAGLMISYRGALALRGRIALPAPPHAPPCTGCARPCLTACPVGALGPEGYDVPACRAHVASPEGIACRSGGCRVRMACPPAAAFGLPEAQRAHHMEAFHR
jgi:epoxyqueuosine reductase